MLICEIGGVFGLVGKSCPIESFGNDYQERAFRRAKRNDLPSYRRSATSAPTPQAGARHRGPELAPDHENLRNPGYWAADKPRRSGAHSLGLRQCLHDAITHFRRAEVLSATADIPGSTTGRKDFVHCSFNSLSFLFKLQ